MCGLRLKKVSVKIKVYRAVNSEVLKIGKIFNFYRFEVKKTESKELSVF